MKYQLLTLIAILTSMILSSCSDAFETTIDVDPPAYVDLLAIQAYGSTSKGNINIYVTHTVPLLSDDESEPISGAIITLYKGDDLVAVVPEVSDPSEAFNYTMPDGSITYEKGALYRIEVQAPGYPKATAEIKVPLDINLTKLLFDEDGISSDFGDERSEIQIQFNDPPRESNYYEVTALLKSPNSGQFQERNTESLDPATSEGIGYASLIINDDSFDGEDKSIDFSIQKISTQTADDHLHFLWRVTSEDHYLYNKTARQQINFGDNPFSSPVQVYSNIENGIGIFTIVNDQYLKVNI